MLYQYEASCSNSTMKKQVGAARGYLTLIWYMAYLNSAVSKIVICISNELVESARQIFAEEWVDHSIWGLTSSKPTSRTKGRNLCKRRRTKRNNWNSLDSKENPNRKQARNLYTIGDVDTALLIFYPPESSSIILRPARRTMLACLRDFRKTLKMNNFVSSADK
jgi:hypothetical protein